MVKQVRLLDIESCNRCKHLDLAKSGRTGYAICKKENIVVEELDEYRIEMLLQEVDIPEWCTLPVVENIDKKGG